MSHVTSLLAAATLLLIVTPAAAVSNREAAIRFSKDYEHCMDTGAARMRVDPAMMECSRAEFVRQDERLNRAYRTTLRRLRPAGRAMLRRTQRPWVGRRDVLCAAEEDKEGGGSLGRLIEANCRIEQTITRPQWLKR